MRNSQNDLKYVKYKRTDALSLWHKVQLRRMNTIVFYSLIEVNELDWNAHTKEAPKNPFSRSTNHGMYDFRSLHFDMIL